MQIIIPMSGFGERFRQCGYTIPKPLIEVDGKPIIAHVLDLFPGETDVVFICNREHLATTDMARILNQYCPTGKIVSIDSHKLGPVYAVSQAFEEIADDVPTIVNYCDFTCYWNYSHFKSWLFECGADGCVPAYRGFHPHSLGSTNYAYMRVSEGWMQEIQEKKPFTVEKMDEYASSGTYYFSKGVYVKRFFAEAISLGLSVNGEYYCSLVYNLMVEAGLPVAVYELQHFMQWGTPQDLAQYLRWSNTFKALTKTLIPLPPIVGTTLIPMAGRGSRFQQAGYKTPKPFLSVTAQPMVLQATRSLPATSTYHFVALRDHLEQNGMQSLLLEQFPNANLTLLQSISSGQVSSCLAAIEKVDPDQPLTISACDHGVIYEHQHFTNLMQRQDVDVIIWVTRGHPGAICYPNMYGWVQTKGDLVTAVSVKEPFSDPANDPMIIGTFTFKRAAIFLEAARQLIERKGLVNREYYVDSCIEDVISMGYNCRVLDVQHYLCWGTPNDLKTFEYWQSCFHKWGSHPYRFQDDRWQISSPSAEPDHLQIVNSPLPGDRL